MHALDTLGDPVRRRILELLANGEHSAGEVTDVVRREFEISQPAVSQHLRVLLDQGFVNVRAEGRRRFFSVRPARFQEVDAWLERFRQTWASQPHLDALATEIARGKRERRMADERDVAQDTTNRRRKDSA